MFEREHHQRLAALVQRMDEHKLLRHHCLLGGGTAIVLARGEYREAQHIELSCASVEAYRSIRQKVDALDPLWLFREPVPILREPHFDRPGIRLAAVLEGTPIKIEVTVETRIPMQPPDPGDRVEGIWRMTEQDLVATRLMANADRYADDSHLGCDIIDLSMLCSDGNLLPAGVAKARGVYGPRIDTALRRARSMLLESDTHLAHCMRELKMKMPAHALRERLECLDFLDSARWWA